MRLVTLATTPQGRPGALLGSDVVDLIACAQVMEWAADFPPSLRGILEGGDAALAQVRRIHDEVAGGSVAVRERLVACGALRPLRPNSLLAPLPDPRLLLAVGMNHRRHLQEMGFPPPREPIAFLKSPQAVIGPDAPIVLPAQCGDMVDWEAEFSVVIGRPCHNVSVGDAPAFIAGYTMINDVSARNWVAPFNSFHGMEAVVAWEQNLLGKQFPTFCPMGPTFVTKDEVPHPDRVSYSLRMNGELMQSACTDDLVFDVAMLVAHYSKYFLLRPGDLITTGSPAGVGIGRNPKVFLKAGDTVTLQADPVGAMNNPVVAAQVRR